MVMMRLARRTVESRCATIKRGSTLNDFAHVILDDLFAFVIERAGCFIKNQDARVRNQCTGNRNPLPLATGKAVSSFPDKRVVTLLATPE